MHHRDIELPEQLRVTTPERCRICGEAIAPAHSSTSLLAVAFDGIVLSPPATRRPPRACRQKNVIGQRMGADGQVRATARLVEIAAGGAGATALRRHGAVHRAKAFLLVAVEIVGTRIARLHPGFNHRLEERIIARLRRRHAHRAIAAVVVVRPDIAVSAFR